MSGAQERAAHLPRLRCDFAHRSKTHTLRQHSRHCCLHPPDHVSALTCSQRPWSVLQPRCRAERAKAKSLKEKFKGASREEMAAAASGYGYSSGPSSSWTSGKGNASESGSWAASSAGSTQAFRAPADDDGHMGEEGAALGGEARPGKVRTGLVRACSGGYGEPRAAAQEHTSLRQGQ